MTNSILSTLANKFCTDKGTVGGDDGTGSSHNYMTQYACHFPEWQFKAQKVLEIGVKLGASLKMWEEYFVNAHIFGLDFEEKSTLFTNHSRITSFKGDQTSRVHLTTFVEEHGADWDIIIDDGAHTARGHHTSLGVLYKHLKPGGIYVIEDLSVCRETSFEWIPTAYGLPHVEDNELSTLQLLRYIQSGEVERILKAKTHFMAPELEYLVENTETCDILCGDLSEIAFLQKIS